jgi:hypothetical protein
MTSHLRYLACFAAIRRDGDPRALSAVVVGRRMMPAEVAR